METRGLVARTVTSSGFRYQAGEEAGSFVDLLASPYADALKQRAEWLAEHILPLSNEALDNLVRTRMDKWAPEFQSRHDPAA